MASHYPFIISLLSLSLVANQCGGVEISVWGLAQRPVFGCGVEIGVGLWHGDRCCLKKDGKSLMGFVWVCREWVTWGLRGY